MDKIKAVWGKVLPAATTTMPGSKLSKAFRFDQEHGVLGTKVGDPFRDGPVFEEPTLDKKHLILHTVSGFFTFLAICTMGAVAGFQAKWFSVSGGTGFVLFLLIVSMLLTLTLTIVPIVYDRWDKLKRPAKFLSVPRSTLVLHAFGTALMLLSAFIVTISAWTNKGCNNADDDAHADLGDGYKDGLGQWCTTKKASAVFDWFSFSAWSALLVLAILAFRRERRREPSFIPPSEGISYATTHDHLPQPEDPYADKHESPASRGGYEAVGLRGEDEAFSRGSVDGYLDRAPRAGPGDETSRTMQLAYSDPYAQIRQSLMGASQETRGGYHQPQFSAQGLPQPPAYGHYR